MSRKKEMAADIATNIVVGAVTIAAAVFFIKTMHGAYEATSAGVESGVAATGFENIKNAFTFLGSMILGGGALYAGINSVLNLFGNLRGKTNEEMQQ